MATVSVIMPAYNVATYIGASIESVQAQTHADWELLIADDGSTDDTAAVVQRYADADPRIRMVRGPNRGISVARNHALRHAGGDFIAILDGDDLWEPVYLTTQLAIFAQHPDVDIVTGNGWFLGSRQHGLPARPWPDPRPQPTLTTILEDEAAIFIMSIMRRRVYDAIGGFDDALRSNEDYHYWLRAAIHGFRFRRNDQPLGHYRRRDDSLSASDIRMLNGILVVFEKVKPMLADRPAELAILNRQVARFERERFAAEAREALDAGDVSSAADRLSALYAHSGGAIVKLASCAAKWTPGLFARAYQLRRARQGAAS
jgi:glycosyltransferase involved in cell wall biosynthesis